MERAVVVLNGGKAPRSVEIDLGKDADGYSWWVQFPVSHPVSPAKGQSHIAWVLPPSSGVVLIGERKQ